MRMFAAHVTVLKNVFLGQAERTYTIPVFFRDREAAMEAAIKSANRATARGYFIDEYGRAEWCGVECKVSVTSMRVVIV